MVLYEPQSMLFPWDFSAARMGHLIGVLARLGLSPADRQKVGMPGKSDTNPFDALDS